MEDSVPNKCNLIINYLPQTLTDSEFFDLFESIGKTTYTRIIRDKMSNYSFGYGFVNYENEEDAAKAIEQLNGQKLQHKTIKVAYSQPSGQQTKNINLHVSGLPEDASEDILRSQSEAFGTVVQCRVIKSKENDKCQGFGFLLYSSKDEALAAIKGLHGSPFQGNTDFVLSVKFARSEQKGPPSSFAKKQGKMNTWSYGGGGPMRGHSFQGRYSPLASRGPASNYYNPGMSDYTADIDFFGGPAGDFGFQGPTGQETIVFVYGIGPRTDEDGLWHMFSSFGNIVRVNVIWNHSKGIGKGYGFVTFSNYSEAIYAINNMNGINFQGRTLQVSVKSDAMST